ncbi:MAG: hypothetical protein ACYC3I_16780 [Gemmataceae bacterium]
MTAPHRHFSPNRRAVLTGGLAGLGLSVLSGAERAKDAPVSAKEPLKITKLETFLVKPRWLFLKIHTNAGITGLGEPILEGRAKTCAESVKEIEPYLIGKDPRPAAHPWQAIYRHAFYRGGPILTSSPVSSTGLLAIAVILQPDAQLRSGPVDLAEEMKRWYCCFPGEHSN